MWSLTRLGFLTQHPQDFDAVLGESPQELALKAGLKKVRTNNPRMEMSMDQYLLIPFLVGWTSIYQLFWCELQGYKVLTHCQISTSWGWKFGTCHLASLAPQEIRNLGNMMNQCFCLGNPVYRIPQINKLVSDQPRHKWQRSVVIEVVICCYIPTLRTINQPSIFGRMLGIQFLFALIKIPKAPWHALPCRFLHSNPQMDQTDRHFELRENISINKLEAWEYLQHIWKTHFSYSWKHRWDPKGSQGSASGEPWG